MTEFNYMDPKFIPDVIPDHERPLTRQARFERDGKEYYVACYATMIEDNSVGYQMRPPIVFCYTKITEILKDGETGRSSYHCFPYIQCAWELRDRLLGIEILDDRVKQIERFSVLHGDYVPLLHRDKMDPRELHLFEPKTLKEMGIG